MANKEGPKAVDVTVEDQNSINAFNALNNKMHELEAQISGRKKALEELEDASNELMLADEERVRYVVGECFVHMDKEAAEERLQSMSEVVGAEVKRLSAELDQVKAKMKELKATLYGKFGKNINLEE